MEDDDREDTASPILPPALPVSDIYDIILHCDGVSIQEQLEHIASRRAESQRRSYKRNGNARRFAMFGSDTSMILGAPSYASHLPEAEPILPGHTLVRPAMGMLKSAIKFPHREQENGAGVYGHIDNLGIKYDGKNERVLYSGFRRMLQEKPKKYLLVVPTKLSVRYKPMYIGLPKVNRKPSAQEMRALTIRPGNLIKRTGKGSNESDNEGADLKALLYVINSLRRDQETQYKGDEQIDFGRSVPNTGQISESMEEKYNKTKQFWETQNSFNHIKINPDAPELNDLLPDLSTEKTRDWWFYHQSDFEEFEDR